jgi:hypothetical protein
LAVLNLANTNKELKPIGDVEYDLSGSSFSMVNGTLMAKGGRNQVNESVPLEAVAAAGAQMRRRKAPLYSDFTPLGPKAGEFLLHARFVRGTKANRRYPGNPKHAGFNCTPGMGRPLERGRRAVTAKQ